MAPPDGGSSVCLEINQLDRAIPLIFARAAAAAHNHDDPLDRIQPMRRAGGTWLMTSRTA